MKLTMGQIEALIGIASFVLAIVRAFFVKRELSAEPSGKPTLEYESDDIHAVHVLWQYHINRRSPQDIAQITGSPLEMVLDILHHKWELAVQPVRFDWATRIKPNDKVMAIRACESLGRGHYFARGEVFEVGYHGYCKNAHNGEPGIDICNGGWGNPLDFVRVPSKTSANF